MRLISILAFIVLSFTSLATVSPQQFGAIADGIHDDTEAIQAALDCRGKVYLPAGVYLISGKLVVHSYTQLFGEIGARIKQTKDSFILYNEHSQVQEAEWDTDISISNIVFDGSAVDAKSEYTAGIYMCGVRNLKVSHCQLTDIGGDGIYLGRGGNDRYCEKVLVNNCFFYNCGRNSASPRQSIAVVFADNVRIANSTMTSTRKASYAVDVEPNKQDEHCSVIVSNCKMIGCGISCGGNKLAKKSIVVNKCHIDCSSTDNFTLAVVRADAKIICNTLISNGKQNGITVVTSPLAKVKKNSIRDASAGILITDGADNVVIKYNTIENCSSGVYVIKSRGLAILSNILRTKGKGVYIRMDSSGTRVENNKINSENGLDIFSTESDDIRVRRNKKII